MEDRRKQDPRIEKILGYIESQKSADLSGLMAAIGEIKQGHSEAMIEIGRMGGLIEGTYTKQDAIHSMLNNVIGKLETHEEKIKANTGTCDEFKKHVSDWHFPSLKTMAKGTGIISTITAFFIGLWHWLDSIADKAFRP